MRRLIVDAIWNRSFIAFAVLVVAVDWYAPDWAVIAASMILGFFHSWIERAIRNAWDNRQWVKGYLGRQQRSEPRAYASMGRFRESSTLTVNEPAHPDISEMWDRYSNKLSDIKNCCAGYQGMGERCPICKPKESK